MKVPKGVSAGGGSGSSATSLVAPAVIVVLVLILGATIYLWRARYIRRRTAYVLVPILAAAVAITGLWMYLYPM